jgi:phage shock protein PspC (stress-responsive transcriptional regulator)
LQSFLVLFFKKERLPFTQLECRPMYDRFQHHRPMISGVCAWMADRSGMPVWIIRVVALLLLLAHAPLMVLGYFVSAYLIRREARMANAVWSGAPGGGVTDRFAHLDRRMAEMEEAAWRDEYRRGR